MKSQLVEAWCMSNEVNLYLLDSISDEYLQDRYAKRTRTVAAQFAHMHNVRLRWLKHADPELVGEVKSFPRGAQPTKKELREALQASEQIIAQFLEKCEATGKVKKWNGSPATFLGYFIAHEAHHRGLAMVAMRISRHKLPQEVVYGQWQWGKKGNLREA
ncbi:MAG: DinB family protein [Bacteroidetes bacterium]|nr:DinB family protein [Bacteroidota bacterium]